VACALYLAHLVSASKPIARGARLMLAAAFLAHAVDIGWLCVHGLHPGVNAREALSFAAWLMCGAYLMVSLRFEVPIVGALVVPTTLVLDVAARLTPGTEARSSGMSPLGMAHITLALAGLALFAVAAGSSVAYLIAERQLKTHRPGRLGGPALATLDRLNQRCIVSGFPLFTVALVTGAIWTARLHVHGVFTLQYAISAVAWLLYAGLLVARVTAGWRGRRAAFVTLAGFATALTVLLMYMLRDVGA
jgi:ABC-type uncharacterized transport system permease subunit